MIIGRYIIKCAWILLGEDKGFNESKENEQ
jgi:hypothetical protein